MYCGWTKWAKIGKKVQFMEAKLLASKNNNFFKIYLNKVDVLEAHIDICTFFQIKTLCNTAYVLRFGLL